MPELPPAKPHDYLRRLNAGAYQGLACVHWSMTIERRKTGWLHTGFYSRWREIHLHTLARYQLACPAFCLMPDHLHLLWLGVSPESDQRKAAKFFREHVNRLLADADGLKTNGPGRLKTYVSSYEENGKAAGYRLQLQGYDHVLTREERQRDAFARVAFYVFENPVRKQLAQFWSDYAFSGAMLVGYPNLDARHPDYWEKFWKIYQSLAEAERSG
jgi:putative transposase